MTIRIVADNEVKKTAETIPPLLFPQLNQLYRHRAERLRTLAHEHPLADYLNFAATLTEAQQQVLQANPLGILPTPLAIVGAAPLDIRRFPRTSHWHNLLYALVTQLQADAPAQIQPLLATLLAKSDRELENLAEALLQGEYAQVGSDQALFLWAALSLYWAQMAAQLPGKAQTELGEQRQFCPLCHSMPVASIVYANMAHSGVAEGLRYLHCSLCESEWHMVRIKCSNCEQSGKLHYYSLDSEQAAIKAESCDDCGSYLKILYQQQDPHLEIVADDLSSLILDNKMEQENYSRSSISPFLFPGN